MAMGQMQKRNSEMVRLLSADFQPRYEAAFAWSRACSIYQALPGLRGFWPMSAFDASGNAQDQSGHGHTLTYNGNPQYNYTGLGPFLRLDGTGDYLSRAHEADLDITGTEAYVVSAARGLTVGGWFYAITLGAALTGLVTKTDNSVARSYELVITPANAFQFRISSDGSAVGLAGSGTVTAAIGQWYFVVGRFDPSAEVVLTVNGVDYSNAAGIPASIYSGAADLNVGGYNGGSGLLDGRASLCFLSAAYLSDAIVGSVFAQTRALFGV